MIWELNPQVYSNNVSNEMRVAISDILGVSQLLNTGRYLGLPSLIGRNKRSIFNYLRERLWKKLQGWRGKPLSKAGKEVLIKSAAQSLPSYCMSVFLLPISLEEELQKMLNSFWWGSEKTSGRGISWMQWNKLCERKDAGGMGFREFNNFNLAMLGKQGWKLISDPDALVTKILKAKYFPREDFLGAKLGRNPSYTWRSIWSSLVLLKRGIRWRIGNGSSIKVWDNPWLRNVQDFYVQTPPTPGLTDMVVHDLFIPGSCDWDLEMLEQFFCAQDVEAIMSIPVRSLNQEDKLIWHYTKNGVYSVKSAYRLAMELDSASREVIPGNWSRLWKLIIPSKVKCFLWRVGRDCLPTRINLQRKGVLCPLNCVLCDGEVENIWHTLINCSFAQQCWVEAKLSHPVNHAANCCESISEWLFMLLDNLQGFDVGKFSMVAWAIWKQRNNQLWSASHLDPKGTAFTAINFLCEWLIARQISPAQQPHNNGLSCCHLWHVPAASFFKCNIDAALFCHDNKTGLGMVLRDDLGEFVACRSRALEGVYRVDECEAIGLHEALSWIRALGLKKVIFEMDAKMIVDALHATNLSHTELDLIVNGCKQVLNEEPDFSVRFVKRDANAVAHKLAKMSIQFNSNSVWIEPPEHIGGLLQSVCTDLNH